MVFLKNAKNHCFGIQTGAKSYYKFIYENYKFTKIIILSAKLITTKHNAILQ